MSDAELDSILAETSCPRCGSEERCACEWEPAILGIAPPLMARKLKAQMHHHLLQAGMRLMEHMQAHPEKYAPSRIFQEPS